MSLSTDLQAAISQLQTDHSSLVTAVRARNGVSPATNTAIANKMAGDVTIQTKVDSLRAAVAAATTESLSLDFANDLYQMGSFSGGLTKNYKFSDLITLTRASVGSRWARDGKIEYIAAHQPRLDHDPITGVLKGLLVEETRTNTCPYSTNIHRDLWVPQGAVFGPYDSLAPDGSMNGLRVIEDNTSNEHRIYVSNTPVVGGQAYTGSIWAKAGTRRYAYLHFSSVNSWGSDLTMSAKFDLQTGTVVATGSAVTAKVEAAPGGWFRISITSTAIVSNPSSGMAIGMSNNSSTTLGRDFYQGGGASMYINVWGPQFEQGAFPTSYIPTTEGFAGRTGTATYMDANGIVQSAATGVSRNNCYAYDSTGVLRPIGLMLERSAVNLYTYSQLFSDSSWIKTAGTVTSGFASPIGAGFKHIPDATAVAHFLQKTFTGTSGTVYTSWRVLKLGEYTKVRAQLYASPLLAAVDFDLAAGTAAATSGIADIKPMGGGWYLCSVTGTCTADGTVTDRWYPLDTDGVTTSFAGDGVKGYYIAAAQLETGPVATSYIPTTTAQVTRNTDSSSTAQVVRSRDLVSVNTLSSWFRQSEGSMVVEADTYSKGNSYFATLAGNSTSYMMLRQYDTPRVELLVANQGSVGVSIREAVSGTMANTTKIAARYRDKDFALFVKGALIGSNTTASVPTITKLDIGCNSLAGPVSANGHIRNFRYYPRRLTDAELQALTV